MLVAFAVALGSGCHQDVFEFQNASTESIDLVVHDGQGKPLWTSHLESSAKFSAPFDPERDGAFRVALTTASGQKLTMMAGYYTPNLFQHHIFTFDGVKIGHRSPSRIGCN